MEAFDSKSLHNEGPNILPVVPTMDVVVFPHMIVPLLVVDNRIIQGINAALETNKLVFLLATNQTHTSTASGSIGTEDLYKIGTVANLMRVVPIAEGGIKILVQGIAKGVVKELISDDSSLCVDVQLFDNETTNQDECQALIKEIRIMAERISANGQLLSPDFHIILSKMVDADKIADFIISHLNISLEEAQSLLERDSQQALLSDLYDILSREMHSSELQEKIRNSTRDQMNQSQKEYYLREQLKAIKKELGEDDMQEIDVMREKLNTLPLQEEHKQEVVRQINRLEKTSPDSMEASVIRTYLEWIFALPWNKETHDNLDIEHAKKVLDEDHHGIDEIKDRILDFISIRKLKKGGYTPILCFAGPPGTGKTSLGKSIARALGREYYRISLGGVKDEAEIRGHRRTYVGAMPGRFIQAIRKVGTINPVIIIDELDKIGADFRGDPSAAMLEVLDPHQNQTFYDNYLGLPFDLSQVMFIATANNIDEISEPLRDRMEIINLSGYTIEEKISICKKHTMRRLKSETGLDNIDITLPDDLISSIITSYTREAGVRNLERMIAKLYSKVAREIVEKGQHSPFDNEVIEKHLGPALPTISNHADENQVGICNGLAWTAFGGEVLKIEAVLMPGKGNLILTGQLGDVMKESAQAALSYAKAHAEDFNIETSRFDIHDLHIHVPAGAVPKDGPSAGITMLSAILSVFTNRPLNAECAMTGELNLQGHVMPIGGVKEKVLAAKRYGIKCVLIPEKNKSELKTISHLLDDVEVILVEKAQDVLQKVLIHRQ